MKIIGAIGLSENPKLNSRAKHIDIKFHYVREGVKTNIVNVQYCPTENMTANISTKGLARPTTFLSTASRFNVTLQHLAPPTYHPISSLVMLRNVLIPLVKYAHSSMIYSPPRAKSEHC